jgi:hypothetical protein
MTRTIMNQIIIQTDCGIMTNISENFERSEVGQTLKSSMIKRTLATQRNCKMILSYEVYFAKSISIQASSNKMIKDIMELNQMIQVKTSRAAKMYSIFSEVLSVSLSQILSNRFPNSALQIYHPMSMKLLHHPLVVANPLPFVFTCNSSTFPPVIRAKNAWPNSCMNVTSKLIG